MEGGRAQKSHQPKRTADQLLDDLENEIHNVNTGRQSRPSYMPLENPRNETIVNDSSIDSTSSKAMEDKNVSISHV